MVQSYHKLYKNTAKLWVLGAIVFVIFAFGSVFYIPWSEDGSFTDSQFMNTIYFILLGICILLGLDTLKSYIKSGIDVEYDKNSNTLIFKKLNDSDPIEINTSSLSHIEIAEEWHHESSKFALLLHAEDKIITLIDFCSGTRGFILNIARDMSEYLAIELKRTSTENKYS